MYRIALLVIMLIPTQSLGAHAQVRGDDPIILIGPDIADGFYDEVPSHLTGRTDWIALYETDAGWQLEETGVEFRQVGDPDDPEFEIVTSRPNPVLLLAGIDDLTAGEVTALSRWRRSVTGELPMALFEFGARDYAVALSASDPSLCDAHITLVLGDRSQSLHTPADNPFACDEPHFDVEWAGDLDGDGALDLVVTFSSKYSHHPRKLFLSSTALGTDLVGEAIVYEKVAG
jgi:hypothetical protein